jgi:hypothetical protein
MSWVIADRKVSMPNTPKQVVTFEPRYFMPSDKKAGLLILIVAATIFAVVLLLSDQYPNPLYPGWRLLIRWGTGSDDFVVPETRFVLVLPTLLGAYGLARYLSLLPAVLGPHKSKQTDSGRDTDEHRT